MLLSRNNTIHKGTLLVPVIFTLLLLCSHPTAADAVSTVSEPIDTLPAAAASTTATAETPAETSVAAHAEAAVTATVTLKAVEQYDPAIAVSNMDIFVHNTMTDAEVSGTLDSSGQVTFHQLPAGTYNIKLLDSYGDYSLAKTSFAITTSKDSTILIQAAVSRLTINYRNLSETNPTTPSFTIAANTSKPFSLSPLASGASVKKTVGFIANGASCGVFSASRQGLPQQEFFTVPFKSSEFCIWIDDADHYLRIFSAHST